jgi:hypothetical protein
MDISSLQAAQGRLQTTMVSQPVVETRHGTSERIGQDLRNTGSKWKAGVADGPLDEKWVA